MFDIIKDLKRNIQKNNMKKLVLSAVLGMFCYYTNNAMEKPIKIDDVLMTMLEGQVEINKAREEIKDCGKKIYVEIKEEDGKVKKGKVLNFITSHFTQDEQKEKGFPDDITKIEQYFHLEEKEENYECSAENLTEIFWTVPEAEEEKQEAITKDEKEPIKKYFNTIIEWENKLSTVFNSYYNEKKNQKEETIDEDILKEIMKDLCGEEEGDRVSNLIEKLRKMWTNATEEDKTSILAIIKRRITLSNKTGQEEKDFISFLKQKIGIKEKKEEEKKGGNPAEEEGCSCCDCCGKKKNKEVEVQESLYKI